LRKTTFFFSPPEAKKLIFKSILFQYSLLEQAPKGTIWICFFVQVESFGKDINTRADQALGVRVVPRSDRAADASDSKGIAQRSWSR